MYIEGEVPYVSGNGCYNNGGFGGFGNGWEGLIGLALVAGLFDGGFGVGNRGGFVSAPATQADLANGFAQNTIQRGIDDILLQNTNNLNFINQGFAGLNTAIITSGYETRNAISGVSSQLAQCCCDTRSAIADVKYSNERNACEIINNQNANTRQLLDYLTSEKISSLQAENAGLKAQISNDRQTATLINEIKPCPIPAYITCNPYQSAYGFGNNSCC